MGRHARIPAGLLDDVPPGPVKVLLAVAQHLSAATHTATVSQSVLAAATGYGRRQLQYHLHTLEELGLVVITRGDGRGRASVYHCPWHLYTVGRTAMHTPGDSPERVHSAAPIDAGKGAGSCAERVQDPAPPLKRTDKENNTLHADSRVCAHGIRFGDRLDEYGISTGGCYRCEREAAHHARRAAL
jgi:DNA-binding transcriptional ArsR family regulator